MSRLSESGDNLSTSDSRMESGGRKVCCQCNVDVSGRKRMKDSQGRYWCYECGAADQMRKGQGLGGSVCPDCMQSFPPVKLMKHSGTYICGGCYEQRERRAREKEGSFFNRLMAGAKGGGDEHAARQRKLLFVFLIVAAATAVYWIWIAPS